ncbi:hypothetical protein RFI_03300, partial [Reticulomyxa filosa]
MFKWSKLAPNTPRVKIFGKSYLRCVEDFSDTDGEAQGRSRANTQTSNGTNSPQVASVNGNKNESPKKTAVSTQSPIIAGKSKAANSAGTNEDEIFEELKDHKNNQWQSRVKALKQLGKLFASAEGKVDANTFSNKFQRFKEPLANHVK